MSIAATARKRVSVSLHPRVHTSLRLRAIHEGTTVQALVEAWIVAGLDQEQAILGGGDPEAPMEVRQISLFADPAPAAQGIGPEDELRLLKDGRIVRVERAADPQIDGAAKAQGPAEPACSTVGCGGAAVHTATAGSCTQHWCAGCLREDGRSDASLPNPPGGPEDQSAPAEDSLGGLFDADPTDEPGLVEARIDEVIEAMLASERRL